jgi:4-amino-4-deoxy-L-arabinose transferase-like glycosyltransferase
MTSTKTLTTGAASNPDHEAARVESKKAIIFLTILLLIVLAVFRSRAFSIDDPLFIWVGRHIQINPGNPYGFNVNWYGFAEPISDVTKNPPLASYFIALAASLLGWSEPALHFAFMLPALGVAIGTYLIATRLCAHPLLGTLAGILTPVFIVSSLTVMSDVLMLAFFVFAVYLWMKGLDETNHGVLALAALFAGISAITKYFGMALIPLFLVYAVFKKRRVGSWFLHLAIPIALLAWYQWQTRNLYGRGLLFDAAEYATDVKSQLSRFPLAKTYVDFVFVGACVATILFFAPRLWRHSVWIGGLLFMGAATVIFVNLSALGPFKLPSDLKAHFLLAIQLAVWGTAGISLIALAAVDLYNRRDADSLLLFLWVVGTFVFAGFINWTTNGRSILPLTIPAGVLIARRLEARAPMTDWPRLSTIVPLAAGLVVSFAVAWADTSFADAAKSGAEKVYMSYGSRRAIWFAGHWGFQYYMEQLGAKPVDIHGTPVAIGDVVVEPSTNTNLLEIEDIKWPVRSVFEVAPTSWLSTMSPVLGAGFYSDVFGPLPFVIGSVPPERFTVFEITSLPGS